VSGTPTVAELRGLLDGAFERAARAGVEDGELAAAALDGLLLVRRHLDGRIGAKGVWQLLDWTADWLLRRELRARTFGTAYGLLLSRPAPSPRTRLLVEHAVEAALAAVDAVGQPVLYLALAELLLDRLELHLGGLPERDTLMERLARGDAAANATAAVHTLLLH